jgi:adenosylhomocysteine nucleosidase
MSARTGMVASMETEIAPLVRGWRRHAVEMNGRRIRIFESERAAVAIAGIGPEASDLAATVLLDKYDCNALISIGLAGALDRGLLPGTVLEPEEVKDERTGRSFRTQSGKGTLVSVTRVAGAEEKSQLAEKFSASAVDMEAAAVASVAAQAHVPFFAVKAISDSLEFPMPDMTRFIGRDGGFAVGRFALHIVLHPRSWSMVAHLARNSSLATRNLCNHLQHLIDNERFKANAINLKDC